MIVSGEWRGTQPYMYKYLFSLIPLPSRLPHNIEQSSTGYTIGPCWLSIFRYSRVYMTFPKSLTIPSPSELWVCFPNLWVLFCFVSSFISFLFRFHIKGMSCDISPSLSDLLHSVQHSLGPSMLLQMALFHDF